jgi:formyltetrahydrofolate deformylase
VAPLEPDRPAVAGTAFASLRTMSAHETTITRIVVTCDDRPGIVSAVSTFLHEHGANILESAQHSSDPSEGLFFLRMEFAATPEATAEIVGSFGGDVADRYAMQWWTWPAQRPKRLAILASKVDHCLLDLLWRARRGDLGAECVVVASNHAVLREAVEPFGVPFVHVPVLSGGKAEAEEELLRHLVGACDVVVLARYMQIVSGDFLTRVGVPVINVHHSLLPAFVGADPYRQARERGVKLIGATAHYVTEDLDAGPIIEQDVIRVAHRDDVAALRRSGADIERIVLSRAVAWHCADRVVRHGGSTVVF